MLFLMLLAEFIISIEKSFYNAESSMIPVFRKVVQLNIKYKKKWGPHNRCLHGDPPDEITALVVWFMCPLILVVVYV